MEEKRSSVFGNFVISVVITIAVFFTLGAIFETEGDGGLLAMIGMILSLQISYLTAVFLNFTERKKKTRMNQKS